MSTHLPECFETWQIPRKCNVCDALRACEERVIAAAERAIGEIHDRWDHSEGERSMERLVDGDFLDRDDALTAIQQLREVKP